MRTAILYASSHGKTRKVVSVALEQLQLPAGVFDVREITETSFLKDYDVLLFFCPTYGDEELQDDMEDFLERFDFDLAGKRFAICELGSYYGYDDFSFGAMRILRAELLARHGREICEPLSLDSFPRCDTRHLLDWVDYLRGKMNEN